MILSGQASVLASQHLPCARQLRQAILVVLSLSLMLSGCRGVPERDDAEGNAPGSWLSERQQYFSEHRRWSSRGRLAISDGNKGLSVNFDLHHQPSGYELIMRTTGGRWTLQARPGLATLIGTRIDPMQASTPEPLVSAALDWPVPVSLLLDWLRALPGSQAPGDNSGQASDVRMQMAADGSLKRLQHQGWTVDYTRYELVTDSAAADAAAVLMPIRLEASSGKYRIRTLISEWIL